MSHSIEKLPDEPIILIRFQDDEDSGTGSEMAGFYEQLMALLNAQFEPAFLITDARAIKTSVDLLMQWGNAVRNNRSSANIRESVLITNDALTTMGVKGMDSEVFKHTRIAVFGDLDEALAYARAKLAS